MGCSKILSLPEQAATYTWNMANGGVRGFKTFMSLSSATANLAKTAVTIGQKQFPALEAAVPFFAGVSLGCKGAKGITKKIQFLKDISTKRILIVFPSAITVKSIASYIINPKAMCQDIQAITLDDIAIALRSTVEKVNTAASIIYDFSLPLYPTSKALFFVCSPIFFAAEKASLYVMLVTSAVKGVFSASDAQAKRDLASSAMVISRPTSLSEEVESAFDSTRKQCEKDYATTPIPLETQQSIQGSLLNEVVEGALQCDVCSAEEEVRTQSLKMVRRRFVILKALEHDNITEEDQSGHIVYIKNKDQYSLQKSRYIKSWVSTAAATASLGMLIISDCGGFSVVIGAARGLLKDLNITDKFKEEYDEIIETITDCLKTVLKVLEWDLDIGLADESDGDEGDDDGDDD
jgi:hypothetical protein